MLAPMQHGPASVFLMNGSGNTQLSLRTAASIRGATTGTRKLCRHPITDEPSRRCRMWLHLQPVRALSESLTLQGTSCNGLTNFATTTLGPQSCAEAPPISPADLSG